MTNIYAWILISFGYHIAQQSLCLSLVVMTPVLSAASDEGVIAAI